MSYPSNSPTKVQDRIPDLDIFRGFAILGIFMVNILVMNVSFVYRQAWEEEQLALGWLQKVSFFFLETVFYSKFFVIFSFLFGTGVALQIKKVKEKGSYQLRFFMRRFAVLFLMGAMHILFLWSGDILHLYAMLGCVLLVFFRASPKVLLWSAIFIFAFPFYGAIFEWLTSTFSLDYKQLEKLSREEIIALKREGSYLSGIALRCKEWFYAFGLMYFLIAPIALSMMLFGGYLVKKGFWENITDYLPKVKKGLFIVLAILLCYRFTFWYWLMPTMEIEYGSALSITIYTFFQLSDIATSLAMLWGLAVLYRNKKFQQWIRPLAYIGRAALSNYIMQSALAYFIMRNLGGYEKFTAFECILLVLVIYITQLFLSKWWFKHYRFGPLEWCWRCLSYGKLLAIKRTEA